MAKSETFDYSAHNKKIASLRGKNWKLALRKKKLENDENPTMLKVKRVEEGLSQAELLPQIGVKTQTSYARIERGEALANRDRADKIAKVLNTNPKNLFIEVDSNKFLAI